MSNNLSYTQVWYSREDFYDTWNMFLKARYGRGNNTLYKHDVVDITRQALQLMADNIYMNVVDSYRRRNITALRYVDYDKILIYLISIFISIFMHHARCYVLNFNYSSVYRL